MLGRVAGVQQREQKTPILEVQVPILEVQGKEMRINMPALIRGGGHLGAAEGQLLWKWLG